MIDGRKVIDCFSFYNELDMLNLRLHEMDEIVDYFVLAEATKTHAGKDKPLYYKENKDFFSKFRDKIVHVVVDDMPNPESDSSKISWRRERHQRNKITSGFNDLRINDKDIIILSDVDEVVKPQKLVDFVRSEKYNDHSRFGVEMEAFFYDFYHQRKEPWYAAVFFSYAFYKSCEKELTKFRKDTYLLHIRSWRKEKSIVQNGGWHMGWFGDVEFIKNKMQSFAHHQEFKGLPEGDIEKALKNDFFIRATNREQQCILHESLPKDLPKYKDLILNKG